jgi:uncharacterized protein (TIGR00369 family)
MLTTPEIAIQFLEEAIPIHRFLGMKVLELRDGYCRMQFPFRDEIMGDFRRRRWHGGIIATALDSVGGAAAGTTLTSYEDKLATIDMRVDYIRGTSPTELTVIGKLVRSGNRIIATDMEAWQENGQKLVATGRAMYSVYRVQGEQAGELPFSF